MHLRIRRREIGVTDIERMNAANENFTRARCAEKKREGALFWFAIGRLKSSFIPPSYAAWWMWARINQAGSLAFVNSDTHGEWIECLPWNFVLPTDDYDLSDLFLFVVPIFSWLGEKKIVDPFSILSFHVKYFDNVKSLGKQWYLIDLRWQYGFVSI